MARTPTRRRSPRSPRQTRTTRPRLHLVDAERRRCTRFHVGDSLVVTATGLKPVTAHRVILADRSGRLFTDSFITDARGTIPPTVVWPLMGLEDPRRTEPSRVEETVEWWGGRRITVAIVRGRTELARAALTLDRGLSRPLVVATDPQGYVRHGFEVGQQDRGWRSMPFHAGRRLASGWCRAAEHTRGRPRAAPSGQGGDPDVRPSGPGRFPLGRGHALRPTAGPRAAPAWHRRSDVCDTGGWCHFLHDARTSVASGGGRWPGASVLSVKIVK